MVVCIRKCFYQRTIKNKGMLNETLNIIEIKIETSTPDHLNVCVCLSDLWSIFKQCKTTDQLIINIIKIQM